MERLFLAGFFAEVAFFEADFFPLLFFATIPFFTFVFLGEAVFFLATRFAAAFFLETFFLETFFPETFFLDAFFLDAFFFGAFFLAVLVAALFAVFFLVTFLRLGDFFATFFLLVFLAVARLRAARLEAEVFFGAFRALVFVEVVFLFFLVTAFFAAIVMSLRADFSKPAIIQAPGASGSLRVAKTGLSSRKLGGGRRSPSSLTVFRGDRCIDTAAYIELGGQSKKSRL